MALPSLSPFASCPSCGGWARRPLAPRETRAHCRGCGWRGLLTPPAPSLHLAAPRPPAMPEPARLPTSFPGPAAPAWRQPRFHS